MRYTTSEKREIVDLVERSSLPVRRTLNQLGIPKSIFYVCMNVTVKVAMTPWWTDNRVERSCTAPRDAYWAG